MIAYLQRLLRIDKPTTRVRVYINTTLRQGFRLTCSPGSYTITGQSASLRLGHVLTCQPGAYTYTGQPATLTYTIHPDYYPLHLTLGIVGRQHNQQRTSRTHKGGKLLRT